MSSTFTKVLLVVGGLIAAYIVLGWVIGLAVNILAAVMPILILGGIVYVGYLIFGRKALGGGRRTLP